MIKYLLLFASCLVLAQKATLFPVKKGDKWGFADNKQKFIIAPQYDFANPFAEYNVYDPLQKKYKKVMAATVKLEKKSKCILEDNTEISCAKLEDLSTSIGASIYEFSDDDYRKERKEIEDKNLEVINQIPQDIRNKYQKIEVFKNGLLLFLVKNNEKSGIIDNTGKIIVPLVNDFIEGHVYETTTPGKYELYFVGTNLKPLPDRYYLRDGKFLIESYSPFSVASMSGSFVKVSDKNRKIKIYNVTHQKYINDKTYDKVLNTFSNGMMIVERDGAEFYIDEAGTEHKSK
ncbi:WG repeat-containing protein [Chryseobacterium soli]|uniref:WG repeat-containing protein n=1 Tax=Chryseobacterium soli TaxID=445961 RepID=UPI002955454F|nr:WG repeat-containing protein [Chryseobacterium soli]MDV7699200.1 WG repeat-containing protein [Chryseobacterium soli]